jgi:hypothetical protein
MPATAIDYVLKNDTTGDEGRELDYVMSFVQSTVARPETGRSSGVGGYSAVGKNNAALGTDPTDEPGAGIVEVSSLDIPTVHAKKLVLRSRLQPIQEWEGYVTDIGGETFTARLTDVTAGDDVAAEEAEFPLEDVADGDRSLLKPGAVFRWTIGYLKAPTGNKKRVSQIVFRRLPQWTNRELEAAAEKARHIAGSITWE